ncbi:MAG: hypothetical protein LIO90_01995 [Bacteroidales bacterium]|nr:hypothetical protein [Bacteroidales bacterium]
MISFLWYNLSIKFVKIERKDWSTLFLHHFANRATDANRGIASVEYKAADLPWRVRFSDGALLTAVYDASGRLLQRTVQGTPLDSPYGQSVPRSWMPRRARPFEFEGSSLKHVHTPTGYLSGGSAFHFVRDHQGSVRQVVAVDGESAALCPFMKQDP